MANTLRIKRRTSGTANGGVPTTSQCVNAELAFNEVNGILYYGKGGDTSASGSVVAIGGEAAAFKDQSNTFTQANTFSGNVNFTTNNISNTGYLITTDSNTGLTTVYEDLLVAGTALLGSVIAGNESYLVPEVASPTVGRRQIATIPDIDQKIAAAVGYSLTTKSPVVVATTANITLSGLQTIDAITVAAGDRVLVKNQTTGSQNGIYVVAASAWTRATDADISAEVTTGMYVYAAVGTTNGGKGFVLTTTGAITLGTTSLTFEAVDTGVTVTAGAGLTKSGTTIDVESTGAGSLAVTANSINLTSGIATAGTYQAVTVDTYGRVTGGSNPTTLSGYGITDALSNSATSTQSGYFGDIYLYDDSTPSHYLQITNSANLSAARTFSINVNDGSRTLSLSGNLTASADATVSGTNTGDQTITLGGDATGSGTASVTVTLANSGVTAGTYRSVTVDAKGRVTAGSTPTTFSGYGISDTSANLAAALSDETGWFTGAKAVFSTSPSFETSVVTGSASFDVFNATATTINAFGAATTATIGYSGTAASTTNISSGIVGGGVTKTINIGTNGAAGSTTNINIGSAATTGVTIGATNNSGTHTINGNVNFVGSGMTYAVNSGTFRVDSGAFAAFNNGALTTSATTFTLFNTNATTVNAFGAATTISMGAATGTTTINNNLTVAGTLTVSGTTTTVNSVTLTVTDKNIEIGKVATPTNTTADGGGITLLGGVNGDKTLNWVNATAAWTSSEDFNLLTGKVYKINGTTVLSASALGTGVTGSSLTSVGTIGTGTWQGTAVAVGYGGTGLTAAVTGLLKGSGSAYSAATAGTDYVVGGTTTVGKLVTQVSNASQASLVITAGAADPSAPVSGDLWNNGGTLKLYNGSATKTIAYTDSTITGNAANVTGTVAIANGGTGQTTASAAFNALSPNTTLGDLIYGNGANSNTRLAGNTTTTRRVLTQTGTGTVSAAPVWVDQCSIVADCTLDGGTF